MKEYLVKIPEGDEEILVAVMERFGAEVEPIAAVQKNKLNKKSSKAKAIGKEVKKADKKVSSTWLFGKWKDIDINPETFRKEVWRKK